MHAHNKKINDWQESFRNYIFSKVQAAVRLVSDCYDKPITPDTVLEDLSIGQQDFSIVVNLLNYKLQVELSTSWEDQKARYKTVNDLVNDVLRQK